MLEPNSNRIDFTKPMPDGMDRFRHVGREIADLLTNESYRICAEDDSKEYEFAKYVTKLLNQEIAREYIRSIP